DHHVTRWRIDYQQAARSDTETEFEAKTDSIEVDYLINACGFRIGIIDDMVGVKVTRMVEFKSSYITHLDDTGGQILEIIVYGERGTAECMAHITPYSDGYCQIHVMSTFIIL